MRQVRVGIVHAIDEPLESHLARPDVATAPFDFRCWSSGADSARLDVATLSSRDILQAAAGDIECLAYRHVGISVTDVPVVALARRGLR